MPFLKNSRDKLYLNLLEDLARTSIFQTYILLEQSIKTTQFKGFYKKLPLTVAYFPAKTSIFRIIDEGNYFSGIKSLFDVLDENEFFSVSAI